MAKCDWCDQEMKDPSVGSCSSNTEIEFPDGTALPASTWHFEEPNGRCHDCGVIHGGFHHPGCDAERCPRCEGQLISCGCLRPIVRAADAMGHKGKLGKVVCLSPDNEEGVLSLDDVPGDFHVFVNGKPAFEGDDIYAGDVIKLVRQTPPRKRGPFRRPSRGEVLAAHIRGWLARWAIRFSHKG